MRELVRQYEVWVFLFCIVLVNAAFVGAVATGLLPDGVYNRGRFLLLIGTLIAIVLFSRGFSAVFDLFRPLFKWRAHPKWYLFALLCAPVSAFATWIVWTILSSGTFSDPTPRFGILGQFGTLKSIFISSLIGEIVWIGYAINRLSERFTVFVSALIVGLFWTAWWYPMVKLNVGIIPDLQLQPLLFAQTAMALTCGFVYAHTKSGLCVLILQFLANTSLLVFPLTPAIGGIGAFWTFAALYFAFAVSLYLWIGPKPIFAKRQAATA